MARLSGREKAARDYKRSASLASGLPTVQIEAANPYGMKKSEIKLMKQATQKNIALAKSRKK